MKINPSELDLFPQFNPPKVLDDKFIVDDYRFSMYPLAVLDKKSQLYLYEVTLPDGNYWRLIGNESKGLHVPRFNDLHYLYALEELLFEQSALATGVIYFTYSELILKADRICNAQEYHRCEKAIERFRALSVESSILIRKDEKGKIVETSDLQIIDNFTKIKRQGRRSNDSMEGYCQVTFSQKYLSRLRNKVTTYRLNITFMRSLGSVMGSRYYRYLEACRHNESLLVPKTVNSTYPKEPTIIEKDILEIRDCLPLSNSLTTSNVRRELKPHHDLLKERKYLTDVYYKDKNRVAVFVFNDVSTEELVVSDMLTKRGVFPAAIEEILKKYPLNDVGDIVRYCDIQSKEKKIHGGFYLRVIQNAFDSDQQMQSIRDFLASYDKDEVQNKLQNDYRARLESMQLYDETKKKHCEESFNALPEEEQDAIRVKAEAEINKMSVLPRSKELLYDLIYDKCIVMSLETMEFPTYEEWMRNQQKES